MPIRPESEAYTTNEFHIEEDRINPKDEDGGWRGAGPSLMFKYTFPVFEDIGKANRFKIQTAIIVESTHPDPRITDHVYPHLILQGYGATDRSPTQKPVSAMGAAMEMVTDSVLGFGFPTESRQRFWQLFRGVENQKTDVIDLVKRGVKMGRLRSKVSYLTSIRDLARNGFDYIFRYPEEYTGVLLNEVSGSFRVGNVRTILDNTYRAKARYGGTRLVLRMHYPEGLLKNGGKYVGAHWFAVSESNLVRDRQKFCGKVDVDPVTRDNDSRFL